MATLHAAPAGQTYCSVEHAGECILQDNASGFPNTKKSFILPPTFTSNYPEPINETTGEALKTTRVLLKKEHDRYSGTKINAKSEEAEYLLFKLFEKISSKSDNQSLLFLRNYELNKSNTQNFRTSVLTQEMGMNFHDINTRGELDAVVVRDDGCLVVVEVKSAFTAENLEKAKLQTKKGSLFFQRVMHHVSGSSLSVLPVVKAVVFPFEETPSPANISDDGSHIIHRDLMVNFEKKWKDIMEELDSLKINNGFSNNDVIKFIRVITGVWCMEPYKKKYRFNDKTASAAHLIDEIDGKVDRAVITSDKSKIVAPVTAAEHSRPEDGYPSCVGMEIMYLTPDQKHLFKSISRTIVRGCAGSGKTIIINMKLVHVLTTDPVKNVVVVVPEPHDARVEEFLKVNGFRAVIYKTFPSPPPNGVIIMTLDNFFSDVNPETLHSYDMSNHHLFIDDLQSLTFDEDKMCTYDDVAKFLENTYTNHSMKNLNLLCAVDEGQSRDFDRGENNRFIMRLFYFDGHTPRQLNIPIFILDKILRSTVEIATVAQKLRELRITSLHAFHGKEGLRPPALSNFVPGHRIRCESVHYQLLAKWTGSTGANSDGFRKYAPLFAVERVKEELTELIKKPKDSMNKRNIAILFDYGQYGVPAAVREMLWKCFQIVPQKIRQSITSNKDTVILDWYKHVASFECACVIMLMCNDDLDHEWIYNIATRARTRLLIVDYNWGNYVPILTEDDVIMTRWEERNGIFYQI